MKKWLPVTILILLAVQAAAQDSLSMAHAHYKKLSALAGTWQRTNDKPGRTTMEIWKESAAYEMRGEGITLKGKDTAFVEKLTLQIRNNNLYYVADVPGNTEKVYFKLTSAAGNTFTFEDPTHDFPQKIVYHIEKDRVLAVVSGNGKSIDYIFRRQP